MAVILFHTNLGESPMPSPHVTQLRTSMMWTWPLAEDQLKAVRPCISLACWDGNRQHAQIVEHGFFLLQRQVEQFCFLEIHSKVEENLVDFSDSHKTCFQSKNIRSKFVV